MKKRICLSVILTLAMSVTALAANKEPVAKVSPITKAVAVISPTSGNRVSGVVGFTQMSDGVMIVADLTGLTPGEHGFHIHEFGDCREADALSAGNHFNPYGLPHGGPETNLRHAGDLGNVTADASGSAHYEYLDPVLALSGPTSIIGRSVIVHAKPDNLHSQPAGSSGARIACGVIGIINPK